MNKYLLCLISAVIGIAFVASCTQQQGTTATSTAPAVTNPSRTPSRTRHKAARRNPPKTEGSVEAPSPSAGESPASTPYAKTAAADGQRWTRFATSESQ